jgi:hypothetical protein
MNRRKNSSDLICAGCGQEIDENHEFFVHKRGTKNECQPYHAECLKYVKGKDKTNDKKTRKNA